MVLIVTVFLLFKIVHVLRRQNFMRSSSNNWLEESKRLFKLLYIVLYVVVVVQVHLDVSVPFCDHGFKLLDVWPVISYSHSHLDLIVVDTVREEDVVALRFKLLVLRDKDLFFKEDLITINVDYLGNNRLRFILYFKHNSLVDDRILFIFNIWLSSHAIMYESHLHGSPRIHNIDNMNFKLAVVAYIRSSIHIWRLFNSSLGKSQLYLLALLVILN
jgi:hypothetical protein